MFIYFWTVIDVFDEVYMDDFVVLMILLSEIWSVLLFSVSECVAEFLTVRAHKSWPCVLQISIASLATKNLRPKLHYGRPNKTWMEAVMKNLKELVMTEDLTLIGPDGKYVSESEP